MGKVLPENYLATQSTNQAQKGLNTSHLTSDLQLPYTYLYRIAKELLDAAAASGGKKGRNRDPKDASEIFQTARMIVIAEWQSIVYDQYLPILLGEINPS